MALAGVGIHGDVKWDLGGEKNGLRTLWVSSGLRRGMDGGADDSWNIRWDGPSILDDDVDDGGEVT